MSNRLRSLAIVAAVAGLASPLVFADQDGFQSVSNEAGAVYVGKAGTLTRDQVRQELADARRDGSPRTAGFVSSSDDVRRAKLLRERSDGWRYIGGEPGWVFVGR